MELRGDRFARIISAKGLTAICKATITYLFIPPRRRLFEGIGVAVQ